MTKTAVSATYLRRHFLLVLIVLGFVIRLVIAWLPIEQLLRTNLNDDSFYYFTIARNTGEGFLFTFDRLAPTNGFHPLWLIVTTPIFRLTHDAVTAVHVVLTLSALLDAFSIYLLGSILKLIRVGRLAGILTCALFALAPSLYSNSGTMNGMESSLNTLLILLFLFRYLRMKMDGPIGLRPASSLGFVLGLLILSRTDNLILASVCLVHLYMVHRPGGRIKLTIAALVAFLVTLPWIVWSYSTFGTLVQVSGAALPFAMRTYLAELGWSWLDYCFQFLKNILLCLTHFPLYFHNTSMISMQFLMLVIIILAFVMHCWIRQPRDQRAIARSQLLLFRWPLVAGVIFVLVHTLNGIYLKSWYYSSLAPTILLVTAIMVNIYLEVVPRGRTILLAAISLIYVLSVQSLRMPRSGEIDKFRMAERIERHVEAGQLVGSWNAGVFAYFSEGIRIINLDGLVNNQVYDSIRHRSVSGYCVDVGIKYLLDTRGSMSFNSRFWSKDATPIADEIVLIDSSVATKEQDWFVLGKLRGRPDRGTHIP